MARNDFMDKIKKFGGTKSAAPAASGSIDKAQNTKNSGGQIRSQTNTRMPSVPPRSKGTGGGNKGS